MKPEIKKRLLRTALLSAIAFAVGGSLALFQIKNENAASVVQKSSKSVAMPGVKIGGDFELVNHDGETVTQANYEDSYKLIYFGFTYCPAICPTELQKVSKVLGELDDTIAAQIQPLFITIDPERDTVEVMREYVTLFDPRLIGLTGSRTQIDPALKSYRVFATRVQDPNSTDPEDYTMDHSSYIYLMSPDDQLLSMYRIQDDVQYMLADIGNKITN